MSWLRRSLFVGVLAAQAMPAVAADMPGELPPPLYRPAPRPIINVFSGWYLRGDVGYAWGSIGGAASAAPFADPTDNKLGNNMFGGIGAGIKTQWLRTDLTLDYMGPLKYEGSVAAPGDTSAQVSAVTALFNGYLDLGTWYRATPYIGAGAGAAQVRVYDYASTASPPFSSDNSHVQYKFAWAAMAGVGYAIAPNIMVDVGYRYLNFGDVTTASDAFGAMTLKNIAAHQVRVGFRWSFDDIAFSR